MAKRRNVIVVSAVSGLLFIVGGVFINEQFSEISRDDVLSVVAVIVICVSPFVGLPAARLGAKILQSIRKGIFPSSFLNVARWGQLLGVVGVSGNTMLLMLFFAQALSTAGVDRARESMIADLNNLFRVAHQYRIRPDSAKGGAGSYSGFAIYPSLAENEDGFYTARIFHPDTLQFIARWREDSNSAITVKLGPDGKPVAPWMFYGTLRINTLMELAD
jgi:hypothetical protein